MELFQIAQANSEHSRHWVFKGELWVDGQRVPEKHLMEMVKQPLECSGPNSVIAFCDDSSAIRGQEVDLLVASDPLGPSPLGHTSVLLHPTLTAETHNFPSGVAPYPGAATGGGGRIRDNQAVGRGGQVCASGAAYCVGNLHIPGYSLPWEEDGYRHPSDLASPLDILIQASNGASDYGNCFGEPLIYGFTRSFGLRTPDGYRSWYKPIMYSVGAGPDPRRAHRQAQAGQGHARGAGRADRPTASAWAAGRRAAWSRARTCRTSTSTPSSAETPRWGSGSTGSCGPARNWARPTPS